PAAGSRLAASPPSVRLVFSEAMEPALAQLSIVGANGQPIKLVVSGDPRDVNAIIAPVSSLTPGAYRLHWRVVSTDGHPVDGSFTFTVGESAAVAPPLLPEPVAAAEELPVTWGPVAGGAPLIPALLRGLGVGSLMALGGLLLFLSWPQPAGSVIPRRAVRLATVFAFAAPLLLALHFVAWSVNADAAHSLTSASLSAAMATGVARVELWRVALAVLALWGVVLVRRVRLALPFAFAALLLSGATGHAAAIQPVWAEPFKAMHLVAAAAWLGGLLWLVCLDRTDVGRFVREASRVSSVALAAVIAVTFSGIVQTRLFVSTPSDLVSSTYGLIVLAKVAGMLILVAFGANHRKRVLPALRDAQGGDRLVFLLKRELAVFAIVVLIGGLLAYVPPAVKASVSDSTSHISGQ
ncbi:MAG: copper resistance protein CopC, partial [Gemmatimonadetes bacterium]|nr:copper resistance protein CopC [Gemmatimonadota bacterium]